MKIVTSEPWNEPLSSQMLTVYMLTMFEITAFIIDTPIIFFFTLLVTADLFPVMFSQRAVACLVRQHEITPKIYGVLLHTRIFLAY